MHKDHLRRPEIPGAGSLQNQGEPPVPARWNIRGVRGAAGQVPDYLLGRRQARQERMGRGPEGDGRGKRSRRCRRRPNWNLRFQEREAGARRGAQEGRGTYETAGCRERSEGHGDSVQVLRV